MTSPAGENPEYYTVQEVADMVRVTGLTVRTWIKDGKLKAIKPGKSYLVLVDDLSEFLSNRYGSGNP